MKYTKPINLTDRGVADALRNGQLKLQRGQRIYCAGMSQTSIFFEATPQHIWAIHPKPDQWEHFVDLCETRKGFCKINRNRNSATKGKK
jgi:hypothetical protein